MGRLSLERAMALRNMGGRCVMCGITDLRVLQADHINGDGRKHRGDEKKRIKGFLGGSGSSHFWHHYRRGTAAEHFQILCANCHLIKTREAEDYRPIAKRGVAATTENDDRQLKLKF